MPQQIPVEAIVKEETYVGEVQFPVTVPEALAELIRFPEDLYKHAEEMGLDNVAMKFLIAVLHGRWGLTRPVDLQAIAINTGMKYGAMDDIVRELLEKNYATLDEQLNLYRFWIVLLHLKGVRFVESE